jgi:uroporphyrinogen-III synthase
MSLAGRRVLVTRPEGQGEALLTAIAEQGGCGWHYPVMAVRGLDPDDAGFQPCKQQLMNLDQFQQIIFVSTNAVNYGLQWIDQYWPQLPVGCHWFGIGKATRAALQRAGFPVETAVATTLKAQIDGGAVDAMNSETLLQHRQLQQLDNQKVLIVRGVGGRDHLASQLSQRGAKVSYAECYRRSLVDKPNGEIASLIQQQAINAVCVNSGESLQNFCQLAGESALSGLRTLTLVVPGERVAGLAKSAGFKDIVIAANASDTAVLDALRASTAKH